MKPLSAYKLSRAEAALRRLDAALDGLDAAVAERGARGDAMALPDAAELADLRARCAALEDAARAASAGIGETMSELSRLLEA